MRSGNSVKAGVWKQARAPPHGGDTTRFSTGKASGQVGRGEVGHRGWLSPVGLQFFKVIQVGPATPTLPLKRSSAAAASPSVLHVSPKSKLCEGMVGRPCGFLKEEREDQSGWSDRSCAVAL
jgi:hypothetical protein